VGNAHDMVQRCFRHQHPELYDRREVPEETLPMTLRYGTGGIVERRGADLNPADRGRMDAVTLPDDSLLDAERRQAQEVSRADRPHGVAAGPTGLP
jgi:hypothetical protein